MSQEEVKMTVQITTASGSYTQRIHSFNDSVARAFDECLDAVSGIIRPLMVAYDDNLSQVEK